MSNEGAVIIGSDASTRQELRQSLEAVTKVVGEASDFPSAQRLLTKTSPAVIFIDLSENAEDGLKLIESLAKGQTKPTIFVISNEKNPDLILKSVRLGVRDFFILPDDEAVIQRTIMSLSTKPVEKVLRGKVISVFSLLGGCGTTTLATNLAAFFAQRLEKKSILFDLDLYKGDSSFFMNIETNFTITDFLQNLSRIDGNLLNSSLARHDSGLYVLGHPKSYEETEDITGEHVTSVLQILRQYFDFIVVDCVKAINDVFLAAMDATDIIILVTLQTVPALKNTKRCLELFEQLGYDRDKIKVVLGRFTKKKVFSVDNIEKTLGWPITSTLTNLEQETTEAVNAGKLLQEAQPKIKLTQEIAALGESLWGGATPNKVAQPSGLFGFLKKRG